MSFGFSVGVNARSFQGGPLGVAAVGAGGPRWPRALPGDPELGPLSVGDGVGLFVGGGWPGIRPVGDEVDAGGVVAGLGLEFLEAKPTLDRGLGAGR